MRRELRFELPAGTYETACKPGMSGKGIRAALTVSSSAAPLAADAALAGATECYQRYVKSQTGALLEKTGEFVAAVKAGDVAKAKALYPVARTYWERIEPVAEIFGDLDPKIDGREEVIDEGMEFTGFHRKCDPIDFAAAGTDGAPAVAAAAHVRLAHPDHNGGARLLRRGYNFVDGSDGLGRLNAGLFFIAYQRDPRKQFVPIQTQLARHDGMNEYLRHISSGLFACPPGVRGPGDFWGRTLFA